MLAPGRPSLPLDTGRATEWGEPAGPLPSRDIGASAERGERLPHRGGHLGVVLDVASAVGGHLDELHPALGPGRGDRLGEPGGVDETPVAGAGGGGEVAEVEPVGGAEERLRLGGGDPPLVEQGEDPAAVVVHHRRRLVGRPVHFSSAQNDADDQLATTRLAVAIRRAGWKEITFEFEPVAAAYHYAASIEREELIMVADFGGGTSDFSIVRLRPMATTPAHRRYEILANDGVAIAGDAFDGEIVRRLVAPELGRGTQYRSPYGNVLPVPTWFYAQMERWHFLSFLKAPATLNRMRDLARQALQPQKIAALIHIVENDLGYLLFKSVEQTKLALSDSDTARFDFSDPPISIEKPAVRLDFESWIARELRAIAECVDRVLAPAEVLPNQIDSVFVTGGSSFVPVVRRIFAERFGAQKIRTGSEFTSIARGLALRALEIAQS